MDAAKGAWGGAWTVVYGCFGAGLWLVNAVATDLFVRVAALGEAALRLQLAKNPDAAIEDALAVLEGTKAAVVGPLGAWFWGGVGVGSACVVAGLGVLRRSEIARRAALGLLVLSFLHAVSVVVVSAIEVRPALEVWIGRFRELWEEVRSRDPNAPDLSGAIQSLGAQQLATDIAFQLLHGAIVAMLVIRLAGAATRAWCDPQAGIAQSGRRQ